MSSADDSGSYDKQSGVKGKQTSVGAVTASKKKNGSVKSSANVQVPPMTGGKVPPSVIKQQQQMAQQSTSNGNLKPSAGMKAAAQQKHSAQSQRKSTKKEASKKKENLSAVSSESDGGKDCIQIFDKCLENN